VECVLIFAWVCNSQYYVYTEQVVQHLSWPVTGMCLLKYYIFSAGHATSILTCLLQVCTCWSIIYTQQVILYWPVCYKYVLTEVLYILSRSYCTHLSVTGMCLLKYYIYSAGHTVLYCNYCYRYVLAEVLYILSRSCYVYTDLSVIGVCLLYTQQVMLHLYWPVCYRYVLTESDAGEDRTIMGGDLHAVLCLCLHCPWSLHLRTDAVTGPDCWH